MVDPRRRHRQLALFLVGTLLLNFPVLAIADSIRLPDGAPLTFYYLVAAWIAMIVVAGLLARRPRS